MKTMQERIAEYNIQMTEIQKAIEVELSKPEYKQKVDKAFKDLIVYGRTKIETPQQNNSSTMDEQSTKRPKQ